MWEDREVCRHILDAFSRAHVAKYPSPSALRSSESLNELHAQAAIVAEHTGRRERGHATFKRRVRASNACGWQETLQMTSAQNVLACWRAECSSWYGSTQPGNSNAEGGSAPLPVVVPRAVGLAAITPPIPAVVPRQVTKGGAGRQTRDEGETGRRGTTRTIKEVVVGHGSPSTTWASTRGRRTQDAVLRCRIPRLGLSMKASARKWPGGRRGKEEEAAGRPRARNPCHHEETFGWVQAAPGRGGRQEQVEPCQSTGGGLRPPIRPMASRVAQQAWGDP